MSFTDDFTRADSAAVGNGWTEGVSGSGEILTNALKVTGNTPFEDNICYAPAGGDFQDGTVQVDFTFVNMGAGPQIYARFNAGTESGYLLFLSGTGTALTLTKLDAGVVNGTFLDTTAVTVAEGTNYRLTLTLNGNTKTGVLRNLDTATDLATVTESADATYTASGSTAVGAATAGSVTYDNFSSVPASSGTITTSPIKNYSGVLQASQSGWIANIYNPTTGALVVRLTAQSTDASGILTLTDPLIVASTTYRVDIDNGLGLFGNAEYTAA